MRASDLIAGRSIGCIGARRTPPDVLAWMEEAGAEISRRGGIVVSGNSRGADQAWARGANAVDPGKVHLCLPWPTFESGAIAPGNVVTGFDDATGVEAEEAFAMLKIIHPAWSELGRGAKLLYARNVQVVRLSAVVAGFIDPYKVGGGGTGTTFKIAERLGVPTVDLKDEGTRDYFFEILERYCGAGERRT